MCAFMFLFLCLVAMAQGKLTPQARWTMTKHSYKAAQRAARAKAQGQSLVQDEARVTLVVKVDGADAVQTFAQLRKKGAVVRSRLGQQVVVSVPVDSVEGMSQLEGVLRVDAGHKGRWKTDVTMQETGVNLIDGTTPGMVETPFTGKGVTICLFDNGFDFQHPAFKDAEGRSRIKCVYAMNDTKGHPFTVEDPELGLVLFPGSVYDTPELIASLTTDTQHEIHGTHTAGIAAGSRSPMGYGGMAPDADIVLIAVLDDGDLWTEDIEDFYDDDDILIEQVLAFAVAYAQKTGQPMVFSGSVNAHTGPHNGTGTVPEAIEEASHTLIPVFSAGNEGAYPIHLYRQFTAGRPSVKTILPLQEEDGIYGLDDEVVGFTRKGDKLSVKLSVLNLNRATLKTNEVWSMEECVATLGGEAATKYIDSMDDEKLQKYFTGTMGVVTQDLGDGLIGFSVQVDGQFKGLRLIQLTVSGSEGTEFDMWDGYAGFNIFQIPGITMGDSEMSGGDWTSTPSVVSVGAYCANDKYRSYDGSTEEEEEEEGEGEEEGEEEDYLVDVVGGIASFSSYGTMLNGVTQPVVCAPGVNIVSSWNHYTLSEGEVVLDNMQWQGYPYSSVTGTSMACPVVSGIIALWLQANPTLTLADINEILRQTCTNDSFTAAYPTHWGYGKVNAAKGIEFIANMPQGIEKMNHEELRKKSTVIYDLQGRLVNGKLSKGLYIVNGKKVFVK